MSLVQSEADLIAAYDAAYALWSGVSFVTQYPNRLMTNVSEAEPIYVTLSVVPMSGTQLDLNPNPSTRVGGQFQILVSVRLGEGSRVRAAIVDHFMSSLEMRQLSGTSTGAATLGRMRVQDGRELLPILVPFWFYRIKS